MTDVTMLARRVMLPRADRRSLRGDLGRGGDVPGAAVWGMIEAVGSNRRLFADTRGHLDQAAVIEAMVAACPPLRAVLDQDESLIGGLPCLQLSWIAKRLVDLAAGGEEELVRTVLELAEGVLIEFGQEGRDFIGACMLEGIPDGGEVVLEPFAGPTTIQLMEPFLRREAEGPWRRVGYRTTDKAPLADDA